MKKVLVVHEAITGKAAEGIRAILDDEGGVGTQITVTGVFGASKARKFVDRFRKQGCKFNFTLIELDPLAPRKELPRRELRDQVEAGTFYVEAAYDKSAVDSETVCLLIESNGGEVQGSEERSMIGRGHLLTGKFSGQSDAEKAVKALEGLGIEAGLYQDEDDYNDGVCEEADTFLVAAGYDNSAGDFAQDNTISLLIESNGGTVVGSGKFLETGWRDMTGEFLGAEEAIPALRALRGLRIEANLFLADIEEVDALAGRSA